MLSSMMPRVTTVNAQERGAHRSSAKVHPIYSLKLPHTQQQLTQSPFLLLSKLRITLAFVVSVLLGCNIYQI